MKLNRVLLWRLTEPFLDGTVIDFIADKLNRASEIASDAYYQKSTECKEMKKLTQNQRLLKWLESGKKIDPLTAWTELGIYRLGSRISELRAQGYAIIGEWKKIKNKYGEQTKFMEYHLA